MAQPDSPHRFARVPRAAEYADCAPRTIRQMLTDHRLTRYGSGTRLTLVDLNELDALLEGRK